MFSYIRAVFRLFFFVFGTAFYILRYSAKTFFSGEDLELSLRLLRQWTRTLMPVLGIKVKVTGEIPLKAGLLVCNHRSYIDPFLLLQDMTAVLVGKATIAKWPIIGLAGKVAGVVFINRSNAKSRVKSRKAITDRLNNGFFVINFAEGTTHIEPQTIAFNPGLFKEAVEVQFPIYPVALNYREIKDAWIGDDTFIRHFLECFRKPNTFAQVSYGPAIYADRAEVLLAETKTWIDKALLEMTNGEL